MMHRSVNFLLVERVIVIVYVFLWTRGLKYITIRVREINRIHQNSERSTRES